MDVVSLLTPTVLLILGGLITLVVTIVANRIKTRAPRLVWRLLPATSFPLQGITAFTVAVTNDGAVDAENVRAVINYPKEALIESFEIQPSEAAMAYDFTDSEKPNQLVVTFPLFARGTDCIFTFLGKGLDPKDLKISILVKRVIGRQGKPENSGRIARSLSRSLVIVSSLAIFVIILAVVYVEVINLAAINYIQGLDIAELYGSTGHQDKAIAKYEDMARYAWFPSKIQLYYRLAAAYARSNDAQRAMLYLQKLAQKTPEVLEIVAADKSFDMLRSDPQFVALMRQAKQQSTDSAPQTDR